MVRGMDPPPGDTTAPRQSQDSEEDARTARHRQYARARRREAGGTGGVLSTLRQVWATDAVHRMIEQFHRVASENLCVASENTDPLLAEDKVRTDSVAEHIFNINALPEREGMAAAGSGRRRGEAAAHAEHRRQRRTQAVAQRQGGGVPASDHGAGGTGALMTWQVAEAVSV